MSCFDLHRKYPAACPHAVGLNASSTGTRLLSLSTIADAKISNPPWVNFQSAGWVSFQSAPTRWRYEEFFLKSLLRAGAPGLAIGCADGGEVLSSIKEYQPGPQISQSIWMTLGLPSRGTRLYDLISEGLPFEFLDRIASLLQVQRGGYLQGYLHVTHNELVDF